MTNKIAKINETIHTIHKEHTTTNNTAPKKHSSYTNIIKNNDTDKVKLIQCCVLNYLCTHKIKKGCEHNFSIFHNLVFVPDMNDLVQCALQNNDFLPHELMLLKEMQNISKHVSTLLNDSKNNCDNILKLETKLINKLGTGVTKVVKNGKITGKLGKLRKS